ncbi:39S ribosomal protein L42, mitochondrial isoform X1 [Ursus arctos]|uniref:39S ribosomal protein L42, mitochondrial isoform X1 n=1 Tax=Ursus arctos TaxID=9644 RepID=UPI0025478796|nr:39S ribosomal protein L42, mitochondrial isoform X1 [Ursus arctos]XP_057172255.1 39S ribosomal protein L42, mitochondrial isoform X1 [Ursus arctos]XP_057172256.1 39S ribosomal protein L42, mitochondrial isoform X1 [Ursus arctos]
MALAAVKWAISIRTIWKHLFPIQNGALYCVCHKSTYSSLPDDYNCKVELALTSDGRTIVCYHPSVDIPYEHTKPIPRPDPVHNNEETHDQVLKTRLEEKNEHLEQGPMIEQLSKMFFTTKHRWYPRGQNTIGYVVAVTRKHFGVVTEIKDHDPECKSTYHFFL